MFKYYSYNYILKFKNNQVFINIFIEFFPQILHAK